MSNVSERAPIRCPRRREHDGQVTWPSHDVQELFRAATAARERASELAVESTEMQHRSHAARASRSARAHHTEAGDESYGPIYFGVQASAEAPPPRAA